MFRLPLILLIATVCSSFDKNLSFQKLSACTEYQIEGGYAYRDAFELSKLKYNQPRENEKFMMRLYVQTSNDAHVLLAPTMSPHYDDKVYEVVLGGWANTNSVIRRKKQDPDACGRQVAAPLLSPLYPTQFDLIQTTDGVLSVYTPGYPEPFMYCNDTTPIDVKYLMFSSWGNNAPARWFFDCKLDNDIPDLDEKIKDKEPIVVNTTPNLSTIV